MTLQNRWTYLAAIMLATVATHLALYYVSGGFVVSNRGYPIFWLNNAASLTMLILLGRDRTARWTSVSASIAASFGTCLLVGDGLVLAAEVSGLTVFEAWLAWRILRWCGRPQLGFETGTDLATFLLGVAVAPLVTGLVAILPLRSSSPLPDPYIFWYWYGSESLGLLIGTPLLVTAYRHFWRKGLASILRPPIEAVVILALVGITTMAVFAQPGLQLLFAASPLVLLAAFRLRVFGAAAAAMIVALVAMLSPRGLPSTATELFYRVSVLQLYLATIFLCALPVAAVLAERDAKANALSTLAERYRSVVDSVGDVIFSSDLEGRWTYLNPAWTRLFGYDVDQTIGRFAMEYVPEELHAEIWERMNPVIHGSEAEVTLTTRLLTSGGVLRWVETHVRPLYDELGQRAGLTGTLCDIDDRKQLEESVLSAKRRAEAQAREAQALAATDDLTGLSNRRSFLAHLAHEMEHARAMGHPLALAIFDVDHFKAVNDRFGHGVGDRVLKLVATRSAGAVRVGDLVGRIGGEEFGVLMPGSGLADAEMVAERFRRLIEVAPEDAALPSVTVSVGVAVLTNHTAEHDLLSDADRALYEAKRAGRNRIRLAA